MNDTSIKIWEVDGIIWATNLQGGMCPIFAKLTVRYTSDAVGKSLSISDDVHGLMLQVPFDEIEEKITGGRNK